MDDLPGNFDETESGPDPSTALHHADAVAVNFHRTMAAEGRNGAAGVPPEGNEERVVAGPVFRGEFCPEGEFRFLGVFRPDVSDAVGDPVNMGVHTKAGPIEPQGDDEIGRLSPHPFERQQFLDAVRYAGLKAFDEFPADMQDRFGLVPVESDGIDRFLNRCPESRSISVGDEASKKSRSVAAAVTSSLVRRLSSVEIRISKGSRCSSASLVTMGSSRFTSSCSSWRMISAMYLSSMGVFLRGEAVSRDSLVESW